MNKPHPCPSPLTKRKDLENILMTTLPPLDLRGGWGSSTNHLHIHNYLFQEHPKLIIAIVKESITNPKIAPTTLISPLQICISFT